MVTGEWLEAINKKLSADDVPGAARPWIAIQQWSGETGRLIPFDSEEARIIFQWFKDNGYPEMIIGSMFVGAFYYDTYFWPIHVPVGFGQVQVEALDCLVTMPEKFKRNLWSCPEKAWAYAFHWADCMDYGLGFDDVSNSVKMTPLGKGFFESAYAELSAAVALQCQAKPSIKAMMASRMAVEMVLKFLLCVRNGLDDRGARRLNHNLTNIIDECIAATGSKELEAARSQLAIYPDIADRYSVDKVSDADIFKAYRLAQHISAIVMRILSDRNIRQDVIDQQRAAG